LKVLKYLFKYIIIYKYNMSDNFKYTCICCNFNTNNKTKYNVHLQTNKHNLKSNNDKKNLELEIKE
jgi:hypothetical protein